MNSLPAPSETPLNAPATVSSSMNSPNAGANGGANYGQTDGAGSYGQPSGPRSGPRSGDWSPPQVVVQGPSGLYLWFLRLGWVAFFLCGMVLLGQWAKLHQYFDTTGGIQERFHSGEKFKLDKIAIIDVSGVIMEGDGFVKRQIDRIRDDAHVKAIVLRVNSPGGAVTGADYLYHHLTKLRKEKGVPMVVSMGSLAASGGYYVSMAVGDQDKSIYAEPTTTTGSIGVIMPHYDVSGLLEKFDVKDDSISSHPRKQMLSMTRPMDDEARKIVTAYIQESFTRFTDIIKQGRPVFVRDEEALRQLATGELFSATQAKKFGLVDEIGFIEDAIDRAIELAKLDKKEVRVVRYERPGGLFDLGALAQTAAQNRDGGAFGGGSSQLGALLELAAPRAYYLSTNLPTLINTRRAD